MNKIQAICFAFFLATNFCNAQTNQSGGSPITIGETINVFSKALNENRKINIYLPEGYKPKDTIKYPVVYLLDGSLDEDFLHVVGLYHFNSFEWINRVPKSIIVGIATVDRRRDYTFPTTVKEDKDRFPTTGHSDKFISFIEQELQAYINKNYNTDIGSKTIIGQSFGALLATQILFTRPHLFNNYVIVSPSIWWNNGSILNSDTVALSKQIKAGTQVYIAVGKEGLTPTTSPRVMEVDANLLAEKIKSVSNPFLNTYFDYLPDENHATILHQALLNYCLWLNQIKSQRQ